MMMPFSAPRGLTGPIGVSNGSRPNDVARSIGEIFVGRVLTRDSKLDRGVELRGVDARLLGRLLLPVEAIGIVGAAAGRCARTRTLP